MEGIPAPAGRREDVMSPGLIFVIVVVVAVFAAAVRYDLRRRHLGAVSGDASHHTRSESQLRADRWGGPGSPGSPGDAGPGGF